MWREFFQCHCFWFNLNLNVAHDMEISHHWKKSGDIGAQIYSDEKERDAVINYLKNRSPTIEEPFVLGYLRLRRRIRIRIFRFIITALGIGYHIDLRSFLGFHFYSCSFSFFGLFFFLFFGYEFRLKFFYFIFNFYGLRRFFIWFTICIPFP